MYDYEAVMLFINNSFFIINMIKRKLNADSNEIDVGVFSPEEKCMGKTYGQYLAESWNKLVSDDPDISDDPGPFLRTSADPKEAPLIQKLTIFSDQAIFIPIITSAMNISDSGDLDTESKRRAAANKEIDGGDDPPKPEQLTIDGKPIVDDLKQFRVESPEFVLNVQDQSPVKDKLDVPYPAGAWPTVAAGYCVLLNSLASRVKPYTIHMKANGRDTYFTEAIYEIKVNDRK